VTKIPNRMASIDFTLHFGTPGLCEDPWWLNGWIRPGAYDINIPEGTWRENYVRIGVQVLGVSLDVRILYQGKTIPSNVVIV
jgi:hypothetical protein